MKDQLYKIQLEVVNCSCSKLEIEQQSEVLLLTNNRNEAIATFRELFKQYHSGQRELPQLQKPTFALCLYSPQGSLISRARLEVNEIKK